MKCELTKKKVCHLANFKGLLISIAEVSKIFNTKEELMKAIEKHKQEVKE